MSKSVISITIDTEVLNRLREKRVNVSKYITTATREMLDSNTNPKKVLYGKLNELRDEFHNAGLELEVSIK